MAGCFSAETDVPGGPDAAGHARRFLRTQLHGRVPEAVLEDAVLLTTELVANGVRHGGAGPAELVHLRVEGGAVVRIEVQDPGPTALAEVAPRAPDLDRGGGLGLHIVDRVSSRWGVGARGAGTSVWFELAT